MLYNYLSTSTAITIWTKNKTYFIAVDDPRYKDISEAIERNERLGLNDWNYLAALIDPSIYELDSEDYDDSELE